jgi:hypothetical protein
MCTAAFLAGNEEPRSPESLRDEVSYRKELLFPYSLANPAASWLSDNLENMVICHSEFISESRSLNKLEYH